MIQWLRHRDPLLDPDPLQDRRVIAGLVKGMLTGPRQLPARGIPREVDIPRWVVTLAETWSGTVEDLLATLMSDETPPVTAAPFSAARF